MNQIKIMTYNMLHIDDNPENNWQKRRELIRNIIDRESPDIIGTQECLYIQIQDLLQFLPDYDWIGLGRQGGSKDDFMAIFYKKDQFSIIEYDHFWLSNTPNIIGSMTYGNEIPRMVTWAKFLDKRNGQVFYHMNTHLDYICEKARILGAQQISEKLNELDPKLPVFLTGDFNTDVHTEPYNILTQPGLFRDTWDLAREHVNKNLGTKNDFMYSDGGDQRIDWILARAEIDIHWIKIVDDCINGSFPSDHFPVIISCTIF